MNKPVHTKELSQADIVQQERNDKVVTLTLNAPERRNSLSEEMMAALQNALDGLAQDDDVRIIIIAANGPVFCAGHDLKQITARRQDADRGRAYFTVLLEQCARLMQTIVDHPKPIIAQVHSMATAAGCQMVASCDLAVAANSARFCTPGTSIGLFCSTPMVALSRNVSRKDAMEMLLTADPIDAEKAQKIGLVNRVVADDQLAQATLELAQHIASQSGQSIKFGKEAFYRQLELPLEQAYAYASAVMTENMLARDAEEGIGAFIDKRAPQWEGD